MIDRYVHIYCEVLPNKDHATCGKERFINPDHRATTLFRFRVRRLGWNG
jgi:hypothetical protein